MNAADFSAAASRLCTECGMCCNGVMFHIVRLQPSDSRPALVALGMKLKKKKKQHHFIQPCTFLAGSCCTIYTQRPERCRLFECQQLHRLQAGSITEQEARTQIGATLERVQKVEALLAQAGNQKFKQPLSERYQRVRADPPCDEQAVRFQSVLQREMRGLNDLLNADFRLEPIPLPEIEAVESASLAEVDDEDGTGEQG